MAATEACARALRSDAERNRARIVAAAREAFAEHGAEVCVDEIARRAGVGMGTLYRRFPTKEQLVGAILDERLEAIEAVAAQALAGDDAWQGFCDVMRAAIAGQAEDRGFLHTVGQRLGVEVFTEERRRRLFGPLETLLARAQAAGAARPDVSAEDLPVLVRMAGAATLPRLDGAPVDWRRHLELLLDGLALCATS